MSVLDWAALTIALRFGVATGVAVVLGVSRLTRVGGNDTAGTVEPGADVVLLGVMRGLWAFLVKTVAICSFREGWSIVIDAHRATCVTT